MREYISTIINKRTNDILEYCEYRRPVGYDAIDFRDDIEQLLFYAAISPQNNVLQIFISYPGRISHLVYDMYTLGTYPDVTSYLFINGRFYKSYKNSR